MKIQPKYEVIFGRTRHKFDKTQVVKFEHSFKTYEGVITDCWIENGDLGYNIITPRNESFGIMEKNVYVTKIHGSN